jgi:RNA polymerase primary sigma factor
MKGIVLEEKRLDRTRSLEKWFNIISEIGASSGVPYEEEIRLGKLILNGDLEARNELVKKNLRFSIAVAKRFTNNPYVLEELIQYSNIGLIKAAESFDYTKGFKFISYAVFKCQAEILAHFGSELKMVKEPSSLTLAKGRIEKVRKKLEQKLEREPDLEEIFQSLDPYWKITRDSFINAIMTVGNHTTIHSPDQDIPGIEESLADLDFENILIFKETDLFNRINCILNPIEWQVLKLKIGLEEEAISFKQISSRLEISDERARQIWRKIINKLRARLKKGVTL